MLNFFNCKYSKELEIDPGSSSVSGCAAWASDRFVALASTLTGSDRLGLQFVPSENGWKVSAVSDKKMYLGEDDLKWVFRRYRSTNDHPVTKTGTDQNNGCKTFAIRIPSSRDFSFDSEDRFQSYYTGELIDLMSECGASMQIIMGREKGVVLLRSPRDLTLRLRAQLMSFFCGSVPGPADELTNDDIRSDNAFLRIFIKNLLAEIGSRYQEKHGRPEDFEPALIDDDLDPDPSDLFEGIKEELVNEDKPSNEPVPIEKMEFSIRTFNCLKRSGISNSEQLRNMTEKEIRSLRSINQKGIDEIKAKLMEMFGTSFAKPSNMNYMEKLDGLIGLEDVKEQVRRIAAFARMKKAFADQGKEDISIALNMAFVGNPGTAKTTVARIIAGIFCEIGITETDDLVEVGRSDLVGEYVGKTALKVGSVFEKAKGKVLFIDEAYSLIDNTANSFGDEAINTLVRLMENHREDTIVIFAGYSDKMDSFLSRNPGLRSRVPFVIEFKDYSAETLVRIAEKEASDFGFGITEEAKDKILSLCSEAAKDHEFGNGRFCRNLVENALIDYAATAYGTDQSETVPEPVLDAANFTLPLNMKKTRTPKKFGFV